MSAKKAAPKKAAKKAAKKSAPAVKLIDGQYSIKQIIRLKPKEGDLLKKFQKVFGEKTVNGTLERLLPEFDRVYIQNENRGKELNDLNQRIRNHNNITSQLRSGLKALLQDEAPGTTTKSNVCRECGEELDEDGECSNYNCDLQFEPQ